MRNEMKAIVWDGGTWPKGLELRTFPTPKLRPGWVLVRNQAAGICGSDLHYLSGETRHLIPDRNLPAVLGHENAGACCRGTRLGYAVFYVLGGFGATS